jgi:hypothetical protein
MSNTKPRKLTIVRMPTHPLQLDPGEAVHPSRPWLAGGTPCAQQGGSVLEVVVVGS